MREAALVGWNLPGVSGMGWAKTLGWRTARLHRPIARVRSRRRMMYLLEKDLTMRNAA